MLRDTLYSSISNVVQEVLPSAQLLLVLHFPSARQSVLLPLHPDPPCCPLSFFLSTIAWLLRAKGFSPLRKPFFGLPSLTLSDRVLSSISPRFLPRRNTLSSLTRKSLRIQKHLSSISLSPFHTSTPSVFFSALSLRLPRPVFTPKGKLSAGLSASAQNSACQHVE